MRRLACALIATIVLAMVPSLPAQAAASLTLTARPSTIVEGSGVTLVGRASGVPHGAELILQRAVRGEWRAVAIKRLRSDRYSFVVAPPRGYQRYRVLKPRQGTQAIVRSPVVELQVTWRPQITAVTTAFLNADNVWVTRVSGSGPPVSDLKLQRYDVGTEHWDLVSQSSVLTTRADGSYTYDLLGRPDGELHRLVSVRSGLRLPGHTPAWASIQRPIPLFLDQETRIAHLVPDAETHEVTVSVDAPAGKLISLAFSGGSGLDTPSSVRRIDGTPIPQLEPYFRGGVVTFKAPTTDTYLLSVPAYLYNNTPVTAWATTPKHYFMNQWCCSLWQDFPGQVLEVEASAQKGDVLLLRESNYDMQDPTLFHSFLDPTGAPETPEYAADTNQLDSDDLYLFRMDSDGVRTLRYLPSDTTLTHANPSLQFVNMVEGTVDGPALWVTPQHIPGAGRFHFLAGEGETLVLHFHSSGDLITPSGNHLASGYQQTCIESAEAGWYDFVVWSEQLVSVESVNRCPRQ